MSMKRKPLRGVDEHVAAIVAAIGRPLHPTKCLDLDAVDRIVAAVTIPADVAVPDIDRQQLLSDLEGELAIYRTGLMMRDRPSDRVQAIADAVNAWNMSGCICGVISPRSTDA